MAIKITEECISCGACEPQCPNHAIYQGGDRWKLSDGTSLKGPFTGKKGFSADADEGQLPNSDDYFFIVSDKCTECVGSFDEPQCASVCPVDCCIKDDEWVESHEELLAKKKVLHGS